GLRIAAARAEAGVDLHVAAAIAGVDAAAGAHRAVVATAVVGGGDAVVELVVAAGGAADGGLFLRGVAATAAQRAGEDRRMRAVAQRDREVEHEAVVAAPEQVALAAGRDVVVQPAHRVVVDELELGVGAAAVPVVAGRAADVQRAAASAQALAEVDAEVVALAIHAGGRQQVVVVDAGQGRLLGRREQA